MHKRRKAGKPKKKPGEKGYPGPGAFDRASKLNEDNPRIPRKKGQPAGSKKTF